MNQVPHGRPTCALNTPMLTWVGEDDFVVLSDVALAWVTILAAQIRYPSYDVVSSDQRRSFLEDETSLQSYFTQHQTPNLPVVGPVGKRLRTRRTKHQLVALPCWARN